MSRAIVVFAIAVVAFVVPTSASADVWADNGVEIASGKVIEQPYEGFVQLNAGLAGAFGCDMTMIVRTDGPFLASITKFLATTGTCIGSGALAGCVVISDKSNVSWNLNNFTTPLVATTAGDITTHFEFKINSCASKVLTLHVEFASVKFAVEGTNPIKKLTISGTATSGVTTAGSLEPEGTATLGIK